MTVALVTGASRGLGRALAEVLARHGHTLVVDARDTATLAAAERDLSAYTEVVALAGDVTDPEHRRALVAAADARGGVDLLVNNAGTLGPSPLPALADLGRAALRELFETNVVAPLELIRLALPTLRAREGAVLNVTSDAAVEPYPGWGGYGASKAALEQLSAVLAAEEPLVRVWWADPGDMRTTMHADAFPGEDISDRPLPEEVAAPALLRLVTGRFPSGRYRAADLAAGAAVAAPTGVAR